MNDILTSKRKITVKKLIEWNMRKLYEEAIKNL